MPRRSLPPGWRRLSRTGLLTRPADLDVRHSPGCARPKPDLLPERRRADGAVLRELRCHECGGRRVWADAQQVPVAQPWDRLGADALAPAPRAEPTPKPSPRRRSGRPRHDHDDRRRRYTSAVSAVRRKYPKRAVTLARIGEELEREVRTVREWLECPDCRLDFPPPPEAD